VIQARRIRRFGRLALAPQAIRAGERVWLWRALAAVLIVGSAALHIAYLTHSCPLDLAPDEAHYWDWSRHLDWSYYSKGPLVAYLIRGGCWLTGDWARAVAGNEMPAVRLPAVACGALLLLALYLLTVQIYRRERLAVAVVAAALVMPPVIAGASLMTIDAPYTCCWAWALVCGYQAVCRGSGWAWPLTGLIVGLGVLAKYTMLLWFPSLALFLLVSREHRRQLLQPGFWIMTVIAGLICLPILVWNLQHDWVSLHHVSGQAGMDSGLALRWLGPLEFVGTQAALLLVFWFLVWIRAMWHSRPGMAGSDGETYLWCLSAVTFGAFLAFSIKTPEEPNWPVAGYLSGLVLAVNWLVLQLQTSGTGYRRLLWGGLVGTGLVGLVIIGLMHHSEWAHPLLARLVGKPTTLHPQPVRLLDPTCRLRGWRTLAEAIDACRVELRSEGVEPVLAATSWTIPGELGFYCAGHPTVYSLGLALGDRHSQYDLWRPNPVWDTEPFQGRTFIVVGEVPPSFWECFDKVEPARKVDYHVNGRPVARWTFAVCRGFKGMRSLLPAGAPF
jgi:hypothetical protein